MINRLKIKESSKLLIASYLRLDKQMQDKKMWRLECRLRVLLAENNLKQKNVIEDAKISSNTITNLVNNNFLNISCITLEKFKNTYGWDFQDLFRWVEVEAEQED